MAINGPKSLPLPLNFFVKMGLLKISLPELNLQERNTFRLHTLYSSIEGIILGVLALNEFVFIKSLHGSNYQLGFLFQFSMIVFIFLLFVNEFLKRIKNRKRMLRITGIVTRLPLVLLLFFPRSAEALQGDSIYHYLFLFVFLIYYLGNPVIYPNINFLLRTNYRHHNFGTLYSWATSINKVIMLIVTFLYGFLLDYDNYAFVYIFPVIAVLGIISVYVLSLINYPAEDTKVTDIGFLRAVRKSAKNMFSILKYNKMYRHFEGGFMLYGFAFMITYTIIYIYFYDTLNLNYSSVAFYRNSYNILAIIILPFFGRLIGKIDPRKFSLITYASLAIYLLFISLTTYFPYFFDFYNIRMYYTLIFYVLFHGVFAASMVLLWNIGSAYFCKPEEAGTYQSIHLFLTGSRASFAPLLGIFFYELFGFTATFGIAIVILVLAMLLMWWSYKSDKTHK